MEASDECVQRNCVFKQPLKAILWYQLVLRLRVVRSSQHQHVSELGVRSLVGIADNQASLDAIKSHGTLHGRENAALRGFSDALLTHALYSTKDVDFCLVPNLTFDIDCHFFYASAPFNEWHYVQSIVQEDTFHCVAGQWLAAICNATALRLTKPPSTWHVDVRQGYHWEADVLPRKSLGQAFSPSL